MFNSIITNNTNFDYMNDHSPINSMINSTVILSEYPTNWITSNKRTIEERLEKIEERLAIFEPNLLLEAKWEELKNLRDAYVRLEKELIEKENTWDILKK